MFRGHARAVIAAAGILCAGSASVSGQARFPSRDVHVRVTLGADGRASVDQEYALTAGVSDPVFEFLGGSCADAGPISATADDAPVAVTPEMNGRGPWTSLVFVGTEATWILRLRYDVAARGSEVSVPIVMPVGALETRPGERGARVVIGVRWAGTPGAAQILLPRLVRQPSGNAWEGTLLAMPSTIRVALAAAAHSGSCTREATGDAGGLEWRFAVFVLTMVVWMAAYLAWFGRPWTARG